MNDRITKTMVETFIRSMENEEFAPGSIDKYSRDVCRFAAWLQQRPLCKEEAVSWKQSLLEKGYANTTINGMIVAVNRFFRQIGREDCLLKELRVQRRVFRNRERELTRQEYQRLVDTAQQLGKERLALLLETICATGIRVSEVRYITVEAVQRGRSDIRLKGKIRTILIPEKLCRKLTKYAKKQKIASGEIFLTKSGRGICRRQIWAEMKALCQKAGVEPTKVFPHNLRHLFARTFYKACRDIVRLADVLGHSSIETTRIYLISTAAELAKQLDRLRLIDPIAG
ncbi:MAG: tyrosine-type recombinase/integrase [Oscillospiraceae bacterium]|nr:tyrosine-type recombinase/integrase [Oscillospiraceae bacterium]